MKKYIAIIYWKDASIQPLDCFTESEVKKVGLMAGISVGIIANEDKEQITIATDWFYSDRTYRQVASYPKKLISKIIRSEIIKE